MSVVAGIDAELQGTEDKLEGTDDEFDTDDELERLIQDDIALAQRHK